MRPQRASRETSIIGEKVQRIPEAVASTAAMRAASSTSWGFQVAACPKGIGNTVLNPCITSRAKISGMPRRDSSTALRCRLLTTSGSTSLIIEPTRPWATAAPRVSNRAALSWLSCPIFSCRVIRAIRESMRASVAASLPVAAMQQATPMNAAAARAIVFSKGIFI